MLLNVDEEMKRFIAENAPDGEFKPVAYYDEIGDFICVLTKNCSYTESRADAIFIKFYENHKKIVVRSIGFTIEGAKKCLQIIGLPQQGRLKLGDIMIAITRNSHIDTQCRCNATELLATLGEYMNLEIEMPS